MGEIAPALVSRDRRVLLIGQAPGADGDLRPLTGTTGVKLARMCGLGGVSPRGHEVPEDDRLKLLFDRANVLDFFPGKQGKGDRWPLSHAREAATFMWPELFKRDRVLFCGRNVFEAFRTCGFGANNERRRAWKDAAPLAWFEHEDTYGVATVAWIPHVSGIVTFWNDAADRARAEAFLARLAAWTAERRPA